MTVPDFFQFFHVHGGTDRTEVTEMTEMTEMTDYTEGGASNGG